MDAFFLALLVIALLCVFALACLGIVSLAVAEVDEHDREKAKPDAERIIEQIQSS